MLPAVYCGLESSALPYIRTGQKPANETGLQGVTYRPCWCFRLLKKKHSQKRDGRCYHKAECHSNCITVHHLKNDRKKEILKWREREKVGERDREGKHILSYTWWWFPPWYRLNKWFRRLKFAKSLILESTQWGNSTKTSCNVFIWFMLKPAEKTGINLDISDSVYAPEWPSTVSQSTCSPSSRAR